MSHRLGALLMAAVGVAASLAVAAPASAMLLPTPTAATAHGCPSAKPTRLGGQIFGWPDRRSLDVIIGIETKDAAGRTVDLNGAPHAQGYTYVQRVNPTLPATGSATTGTKSWGGICISPKIVQFFAEAYPKGPDGVTRKVRYGEAARYFLPITAGANNVVDLRLPLRHELGGDTGYVNGYLTHLGHRINPALITRVRAFTRYRGTQCGVPGLAASADALGYSRSLDATYYRIDALAAGQCGAATQAYTMFIDCKCGPGGSVITRSRVVSIANGRGVRVDIAF
jgi:hypothetical protein